MKDDGVFVAFFCRLFVPVADRGVDKIICKTGVENSGVASQTL